MPQGKISDNNTRISIVISKELKSQATEVAQKENRSLSNLIVSLLTERVNKQDDTE